MKDLVISGKTLHELRLKPSELLIELAVHLYDVEKLSMGRAKKLAGLSQIEFQKEMMKRNVRLKYDISDLDVDLKNIKGLD